MAVAILSASLYINCKKDIPRVSIHTRNIPFRTLIIAYGVLPEQGHHHDNEATVHQRSNALTASGRTGGFPTAVQCGNTPVLYLLSLEEAELEAQNNLAGDDHL